jgi:hypothetical protein
MNFVITQIADKGQLDRERIIIRALKDDDIGDYAIFKAKIGTGENVLPGNVPNAYWFIDIQIKAGDYVVLYTKVGKRSEKEISDAKSYFFYWGLSAPIWDDSGYVALLVSTPDWSTLAAPSE